MKNKVWPLHKAIFIWHLVLLALVLVSPASNQELVVAESTEGPKINLPYFEDNIPVGERAIFWFGELSATSNYADVRVGYNAAEIVVQVPVFDRLLYFDTSPTVAELEQWDAVTLYLDVNGNSGTVPQASSYRFVGQHTAARESETHYGSYQGNGAGWVETAVPFTFNSGTQASGFNDDAEDRGHWVSFAIPFSSLGLNAKPADGTIWGAGLTVHDRDDAAGTAIADQHWPDGLNGQQPATYGRFSFGLPIFTPPAAANVQTSLIRQGENGIVVPDGHVGGHSTCGAPYWPDQFFTGWPNANYAGLREINIQNQFNLGDWPCFSKYFVSFPLDTIPSGKMIRSATLSMYQFGNAGQTSTPTPEPTLIQVMTATAGFDEATLTWNNGPGVQENVSAAWAGTIPAGGEGFFVTWDVSRAVSEAYLEGGPLDLTLYTADGNRNSGKYFVSSDGALSKPERRPTLIIEWGDPPLVVMPPVQQIGVGETAEYTISAAGLGGPVNLSVQNPDPTHLEMSLSTSSITPPETAVLTVTDLRSDVGFGSLAEIVVSGTGDGINTETTVYLLVEGQQIHLPLTYR